jgi:hypothetical protein
MALTVNPCVRTRVGISLSGTSTSPVTCTVLPNGTSVSAEPTNGDWSAQLPNVPAGTQIEVTNENGDRIVITAP